MNRILLVSAHTSVGLREVFVSYHQSLLELGVVVDTFDMQTLFCSNIITLSPDAAYALLYAKLHNVENNYTHCILIGGFEVPTWFYKSSTKKIVVINPDDPYITKLFLKNNILKHIYLYLSNEIAIVKYLNDKKYYNVYYLPVASSQDIEEVNIKNLDISFIGCIYPNRINIIEKIIKIGKEIGLKMFFGGTAKWVPKDSIIRKVFHEGAIIPPQARYIFSVSKAVINVDRDPMWDVTANTNCNPYGINKAQSMNPRAYNIAYHQSLQLYCGNRKEYRTKFGNNIFYIGDYTDKQLKELLLRIKAFNKDVISTDFDIKINDMIANAKKAVSRDTYKDRAKQIIEMLKL